MRRALRWLLGLTLLAVASLLGVGALVQVFLHTKLPALLNAQPDRLLFSYDSAWMVVPGRLHVRGLRIEGHDPAADWVVEADEAVGWVALWALANKTFRTTSLRGEGVRFSYQPVPRRDMERMPVDERWTVDLQGMRVLDVQEVAYGDYTVSGSAEVEESHLMLGPTEIVSEAQVSSHGLSLRRGEELLTSDIQGTARLVVDELPRRGDLGRGAFALMGGEVHLEADTAGLSFLDYYLSSAPWLHLEGPGRLGVDLEMKGGRLLHDSVVAVQVPDMLVDVMGWQVTGEGVVGVIVDTESDEPGTLVSLDYRGFELGSDEGQRPLLEGDGFRLTAHTPDTRLDAPFSVIDVVFDLPESQITTLASYNALLPNDMDFDIAGGGGTVRGHLEATTREEGPGAEGELWLVHPGVQARLGGVAMTGDVTGRVRLNDADLEAKTFELGGTHVELAGASLRSEEDPDDGVDDWHARVTLPWSRVSMGADEYFVADLDIACRDTGPLVTLFGSQGSLPGWAHGLLTVRDPHGTGRLMLASSRLELRDVSVEGNGFEVLAELVRQDAANQGKLYARMGPLSVGLEVNREVKHVHLLGARRWFDRAVDSGEP